MIQDEKTYSGDSATKNNVEGKGAHDGHRRRIIDKLETGGLLEHELLEIFLFNAIPRKNTNELAHRLISEFKTMRGVFSAKLDDLKEVRGVGDSVAAYLVCAGKIFERFYEFEKCSVPKIFDRDTFFSFVREEYSRERKETLDFYFFDENKRIFNRRRFSRSEDSRVDLDPADLTKMLLDNKPTGMIAVHNHPYGSCLPSDADDDATRKFLFAASFHNVLFCDHFIYGDDGVYSYYKDGKMAEYSQNYSVTALMRDK